ncbi:YhbD family protein [Paenibacillus macquariensis]|uniref:DUF4004 domain-containing protein n=1 Tax=Paenibacillus macquariensis TaxID=948756 RepID=A0ABY1K6R2_9BACL|nr:YhbD family protein [Paenibacillus macquariensis]MEC0093621.1 YhbD family protein [Paenibacillus macquariensis]OAB35563.1 hypothetical protein PMSM_09955 [Paenibacillus macquariensis subsp. macquariensis]SIR33523.1 Protein of unknown function [Paenibacillus macquariensis]
MDDDLISKKELLEITGISYGQLYRWKRKSLIPEDWFIRKSSYTGQETFFPRHKIIARVDKIINMKDDLSLDELADVFSPSAGETSLRSTELIERNIVSLLTLDLYVEISGQQEEFTFDHILCIYILEKLLKSGELSREEGLLLVRTMEEHYGKLAGKNAELVLIRKMGVSILFLTESADQLYFDKGVKWVIRLPIASSIEELKLKMNEREEA